MLQLHEHLLSIPSEHCSLILVSIFLRIRYKRASQKHAKLENTWEVAAVHNVLREAIDMTQQKAKMTQQSRGNKTQVVQIVEQQMSDIEYIAMKKKNTTAKVEALDGGEKMASFAYVVDFYKKNHLL